MGKTASLAEWQGYPFPEDGLRMVFDDDLANSLLIGSQQISVGACEQHDWQYRCMSLRQQQSGANQRLTVR